MAQTANGNCSQRKARREVKEQAWRIFELHFVEDRSANEIAEQLGIKVGAVYTSLCRFLKEAAGGRGGD